VRRDGFGGERETPGFENLSTSFRLQAVELPLRHVTSVLGKMWVHHPRLLRPAGKTRLGCWGSFLHEFRQSGLLESFPPLPAPRLAFILECKNEGQMAIRLKIHLAPTHLFLGSIGVQMALACFLHTNSEHPGSIQTIRLCSVQSLA